jgi:hypothetical protein
MRSLLVNFTPSSAHGTFTAGRILRTESRADPSTVLHPPLNREQTVVRPADEYNTNISQYQLKRKQRSTKIVVPQATGRFVLKKNKDIPEQIIGQTV